MPHVIIKLWPGRTEEQKIKLTERIVKDMTETFNCPETAVSVAFEEVETEKWEETVVKPDIIEKEKYLYKKPGNTK